MEPVNQQSSKNDPSTDYYNLAHDVVALPSDMSQYDTSKEYINDTWKIVGATAANMRAQLEEFMEGDVEFIGEFALYISRNMESLENQLLIIYEDKDLEAFKRLKHMVKPTIQMVGDHELLKDLYQIQQKWEEGDYHKGEIFRVISRARSIHSQLKIVIANSGQEAA